MTPGPLGREELETLLRAALDGVDAGKAVGRSLSRGPAGALCIGDEALSDRASLTVLAAGKAAVPMAQALVDAAGAQIGRGLIVTKDGHGSPVPGLPLREAGHPVPDARSEAAGREALELAASARTEEVLVVLLSGGASALLSCPAPGLRQADLAATTAGLLAGGADIVETNTVRKHLSAIAGGQLARAWCGGPIFVLALSDVPGDRLDVIGSGPCSADPSRFEDAWEVLSRRGLEARIPPTVARHIHAGRRGAVPETPKPGDSELSGVRTHVVARNADALAAAEAAARERGLRVAIDPQALVGEASEAAVGLLARARAAAAGEPLVWLAGGETSVTFDRAGRGGRNQELALAAALEIEGDAGIGLLAVGSDGTDGPTDAAGAHADGGSVVRGAAHGLDARDALARHDSYTFWAAEGGLLRTGPTGTNVMDLVFVTLS